MVSAGISLRSCSHSLWIHTQKWELLDHMVVLFLVFLRNKHTVFHNGCTILHAHQQCIHIPFSPHLPQHLLSRLFDKSHSKRNEVISHCDFDEHLFIYPLAICMSSLENCLFGSPAHLLIGLFGGFFYY